MYKVGFKHHSFGDLVYLAAPNLSESGVCVHAFTTRHGGVSKEDLYSMNLGLNRGDDIENVRDNLRILGRHAGFSVEKSVYTTQKHGCVVVRVDKGHAGYGAFKKSGITEADALVTNQRGIPLVAYFADCVSVILLDPVKRAAAVCHSGWCGTVLEIAAKTAAKMKEEYGTMPEDILAAIGPSIGPCHFEVREDVAAEFYRVFPRENGFITKAVGDKFMIDLQGAVAKSLNSFGVPYKNIYASGECTFCRPDKYFSHRYFKGKTGNLAAVIELI